MAATDFCVEVSYPRDLEAVFYAALETRHWQTVEESQSSEWWQRISFGLSEQAMDFSVAACEWLRGWDTTCQGEPFHVTLPDGKTISGTIGEQHAMSP